MEALAVKTIAWENERGTEFTYDGVRKNLDFFASNFKKSNLLYIILCRSDFFPCLKNTRF